MINEVDDEVVGAVDMSANGTSNGDTAVVATKKMPERLVTFNLLTSHLKIVSDVRQERDYSLWKSAQDDDYTLWVSDKETEFITFLVDRSGRLSKDVLVLARWKHTTVGNFIQFRQGQDLDYTVWLSLSPTATTFKPAFAAGAAAGLAVRKDFSAWTTRHDGEYDQFKLIQEGSYYQIKSNLERQYARDDAIAFFIVGAVLVSLLIMYIIMCIQCVRMDARNNKNTRKH